MADSALSSSQRRALLLRRGAGAGRGARPQRAGRDHPGPPRLPHAPRRRASSSRAARPTTRSSSTRWPRSRRGCSRRVEAAKADHRPRRLRRRRRLLDRDPRPGAARARRRVRLADPRPPRRRLRADPRHGRGARGARHRAAPDRRLRDRLRGRGRRRGGAGSRRSSPTTTSRRSELPDCPILHPVVSGYPFAELCATAVAYKLSAALRRDGRVGRAAAPTTTSTWSPSPRSPTWCRWSARTAASSARGLAEARRGAGPGLRALIAVSRTDPTRLDEGDLGFRLAPRINAAGRLYRADAGVELMLTEDDARAAEIAAELDRANYERRATEREALDAAERALAPSPPRLREAPGDRARRRGLAPRGDRDRRLAAGRAPRPAGRADRARRRRGPRLGAQHPRLRPGRRARGLRRAPDPLRRPRRRRRARDRGRFGRGVPARLPRPRDREHRPRAPGPARARRRIGRGRARRGSASSSPSRSSGSGRSARATPSRACWSLAARLREVRPMGESGDHARFQLAAAAGRRSGSPSTPAPSCAGSRTARPTSRCASRSTAGTASRPAPRRARRASTPPPEDPDSGRLLHARRADEEWWRRFAAELERAARPTGRRPELRGSGPQGKGWGRSRARRPARGSPGRRHHRAGLERNLGAGAVRRRRAPARPRAERRRSPAGSAASAPRSPARAAEPRAEALERAPRPAAWRSPTGRCSRATRRPRRASSTSSWSSRRPSSTSIASRRPPTASRRGRAPLRPGFIHIAWGEAELRVARAAARARLGPAPPDRRPLPRPRGARSSRGAGELAAALAGDGPYPRTPELAARAVRVLVEAGLCAWQQDGTGGVLRVVSSEETDLERSQAYRAYRARHEEGKQYLRRQRQPSGKSARQAA